MCSNNAFCIDKVESLALLFCAASARFFGTRLRDMAKKVRRATRCFTQIWNDSKAQGSTRAQLIACSRRFTMGANGDSARTFFGTNNGIEFT